MSIPSSPCKDCPDRFLGCHGICEDYQNYKKEMGKFNKQRNKDGFPIHIFTHPPKGEA